MEHSQLYIIYGCFLLKKKSGIFLEPVLKGNGNIHFLHFHTLQSLVYETSYPKP